MDTEFTVICPYCAEEIAIYLEPEIRGTLVMDCEVCCNPWEVRVFVNGDARDVEVTRGN